jgi:Flp pilus assembly pilin Flp
MSKIKIFSQVSNIRAVKMRLRISNAQSTLEYVIILAIVAAAIVGAAVVFKSDIAKAYNEMYGNTTAGS